MRKALTCMGVLGLLAVLAIILGPRAISVSTWLRKFPHYGENVTRWGLPLHPSARPRPYGTWGETRHMHEERFGVFRFVAPEEFAAVRDWYTTHLPESTWSVWGAQRAEGSEWNACRLNEDGLTTSSIRLQPDGQSTIVYYNIPPASEAYQSHLRRLRRLSEDAQHGPAPAQPE